jgi:hypothetical protein
MSTRLGRGREGERERGRKGAGCVAAGRGQRLDLDEGFERVLELLLQVVGLEDVNDTEVEDVAFRSFDTVPVLTEHRYGRPRRMAAHTHNSHTHTTVTTPFANGELLGASYRWVARRAAGDLDLDLDLHSCTPLRGGSMW